MDTSVTQNSRNWIGISMNNIMQQAEDLYFWDLAELDGLLWDTVEDIKHFLMAELAVSDE